ncbi:MAG: DUF3806 domain-containing protein [Gammaproteobacteria bacterium]|nr:DUF3806 domain-containing protein [Gammaproteobacteria bacterium]
MPAPCNASIDPAAGRRRRVPWWRWFVTGALGFAMLVAALHYFAGQGLQPFGVPLVPGLGPLKPADVPAAPGGPVYAPSDADLHSLAQQRALVAAWARRYVGSEPRGQRDDLRILQALIDRKVAGPDETYQLQALGVVFGDVLAHEFGLHWVIVSDREGRSRALQLGDTTNYLFPVTMISKRLEKHLPVDVEQLYEKARAALDGLPGVRGRGDAGDARSRP